jgi:hypothetical protein
MRYWEIIADNLSQAGWSWGCVSAGTREGRIIWVADAHRDDGKCFFVHAAEKLTEFLELESAIRKIALTLYLRRWQSRGRVKSVGRGDPEVHPTLFLQGSTVDDGFCTNN